MITRRSTGDLAGVRITHLLLGFGGPDYDLLSPLEELIIWRDDYRERNPEAAG